MEFHISRALREKLEVDDLLFSYTGNIVFANVAASRTLAKQLQGSRTQRSRDLGACKCRRFIRHGAHRRA